MINAFLFPHLLDSHVMMGMIKNAVAIGLIVENHAGHVPVSP